MAKFPLVWQDAGYLLDDKIKVTVGSLRLERGSLMVLIGGNGSGKSLIARALSGDENLKLRTGKAPCDLDARLVSLESQIKLFEQDFRLRNTDAATAKEEIGITPRDLIGSPEAPENRGIVELLGVTPLLDKGLRQLSGGEGRRALLAAALCARCDLLVLDTPFEALDEKTRTAFREKIPELIRSRQQAMVLIVNRAAEIPPGITGLGFIHACGIEKLLSAEGLKHDEDAQALLGTASLPEIELPRPPARFADLAYKGDAPLVKIRDLNVTYQRPVFTHFDFTVHQGEHWQILGPNGAGKSTLLSFITGDNPLTYINKVSICGIRRGSGESIWDIRRLMGIVSGQLHLEYRVAASVLSVVLSGFHDSIGLYRRPGDDETGTANEWLRLAGMQNLAGESFSSLSFGRQRLLLILRALVKEPPLLILDEPLHGLDSYARALVLAFVSHIMAHGRTSVLFVSHHTEDLPSGCTHRLTFVPDSHGGFHPEVTKLA